MSIKKSYRLSGCKLSIEAKTNRVIYQYTASGIGFEFDLLSEVGRIYQPVFRQIIADNNLRIETYDNPQDNYRHGYYERLAQ